MNSIDFTYRFSPANPDVNPAPPDAASARQALEDGNRRFSRWMAACRSSGEQGQGPHVIDCNRSQVGMVRQPGGLPTHAPFAIVLGCSDARVPIELAFGRGFGDLFVVRVAGNILGDPCQGSIDYALHALSGSLKAVVVLGHMGCGAVTGAVDAYLHPQKYWSQGMSPQLRGLLHGILVSVREAANGLNEVWGPDASRQPGYRAALIETAVCVNAAQTAYDLRQQVAAVGNTHIDVLYGAYNLNTHQISMPLDPHAPVADQNVTLAEAPRTPAELGTLAQQMARLLHPTTLA